MMNNVKPRNVPFKPNLEEKTKTALYMANYLEELHIYRENRHRPKNPLYYLSKLMEECGELAEGAVALDGSRRKVKKLSQQGTTPRDRIIEELGDIVNVVFLMAEQYDIPISTVLEAGSSKLTKRRNSHG